MFFHPNPSVAHSLPFVSMEWTSKLPESSKILQKHRYISLLLLFVTMIMNNWFKFGFDIHHWSISYLGWLQDHIDTISHLDFGYFDLVNPVYQVNHVSQGSDSKKQHDLYLFRTYPGPILYLQFWDFGPGSPNKWLLSLNYWPNDQILFQMAVWLVLLEQSNVPRGMSSHLYHSSMSPYIPVQLGCSSSQLKWRYYWFVWFSEVVPP